jgi:CSLREA domain-containing protein
VVVLVALWLMPSGRALANTFQVTKVLDTNNGTCDGGCSLREAIIAANQHPGPDSILVPAGTYVLMQVGQEENVYAGDLDIHDDVTIIGAGAESTIIDGNRTDRVFHIHGAAVVRMSDLAIQNGVAILNGAHIGNGGGIYNDSGTLTLENCTLSENSATDGGGGIYNAGGTLTLTSCTLSKNSAIYGGGGGIFNADGTLTLTSCTLSENSASNGGGIYTYYYSTATLTNCTLSGNSAPSGNGAGISGWATVTNTILANSPRGRNCMNSVQSMGHNLDDDGSCGFFNTGDLSIGVTANLAPLGNYGGPTQTIALCTTSGAPDASCGGWSQAIDAGDNACCRQPISAVRRDHTVPRATSARTRAARNHLHLLVSGTATAAATFKSTKSSPA